MAHSIPPPVVRNEAAERRNRTEGLLRRLRAQAAISEEHRRVASEATAGSPTRGKWSRPANVDDRTRGRTSRALPQD
jgi:hypothetical protein